MNKVLAVVVGVLAMALGGALLVQQQTNAGLRAEMLALRADLLGARPANPAGAQGITAQDLENVRREWRMELARLREELTAVNKVGGGEHKVAKAEAKTPVLATAAANPLQITAVADLKNAGKATPSLALQTLVWAAAGGDVDVLAGTIVLDPDAQQKAQALFDRMPETTRAQYGSPEKLAALFIAKDVAIVNGMQVTNENLAGDNARVSVLFQNAEGGMKEDTFRFHQGAAGWQLQVSGKAIDKFERGLSGGK